MAPAARFPQEMVQALARGATILTGNQRAARTLRRQFDLHQRSLGLPSWQPPAILAWENWTSSLWQRLLIEGHTDLLLLNRTQEHLLWRSIIASDPEWRSLRSADSLAQIAADAWSRLCAYDGEKYLARVGVSADTRAFRRWATIFERRCRSDRYLSAAQLESTLQAAISSQRLAPDSVEYLLIGFDSMTPVQEALCDAVRSHRAIFQRVLPQQKTDELRLLAAADPQEEITLAARWIRRHLEKHPEHRIALIVPDVADHRSSIERVLRNVLAPEQMDITTPHGPAPFEFSLGVPLTRMPMVITALDLLRWTTQPLPLERISQLLLSPYFGSAEEKDARAAFDAYALRQDTALLPQKTLEAMHKDVDTSPLRLPWLAASLRAMCRVCAAASLAENPSRTYTEWSEFISSLLDAAGWSGPRSAADDSIAFQLRRRWQVVLDELATLDFEGIRIPFSEALATVERIAQQTLFTPVSLGAPVQVMEPLESAGSEFDLIWFLRAGDLAWPVRPNINPLLPWHLQQELHMPGADLLRNEEQALQTTQRIAHSAPVVFFSYAVQTEEEKQRPSSVFKNLPIQQIDPHDLLPEDPAYLPVALEAIEDTSILPHPPEQVMRGGAEVLKLQAACGFRAFAERRLRSTTLDTVEAGLDASELGNAVHVVMEHFWDEVRTQERLKSLLMSERQSILARAIDLALRKNDTTAISPWETAYMKVQHERLLTLLDAWLLAEMEREVPYSVKSRETRLKEASIGPLHLSLRIDRIDETEFGDVILDYKTGHVRTASWLGERPDDPQLPLYAVLAAPKNLAGVAFAQLRAGKDMKLQGYQAQAGLLLHGIRLKETATLEGQLERWREVLSRLALEFHEGDVRVRPKQYPNTCQYCAQRILCRLDTSSLATDEDDPAEEADHG